jgi:hypothetical protein
MLLDDVIRGYMVEKGHNVDKDYQRIYQIAVRGLKDLWFDVTGTPAFVNIVLDSNGQADLPEDFLNFIRVGVINVYGELISLGENQRLAFVQNTDACGNDTRFPVQRPLNTNEVYPVGSVNSVHSNAHGEVTGGFYGVTGRVGIGEYKINYETNQIMVSNVTSYGTLVLEYLSNLTRSGADYDVHEFLVEPLYAWIEWKTNALKTSVPLQTKDYLKNEYYRTKFNLRLQRFARNSDVIQQYARKNSKQIKF